jgi:hypothetical protein
VSTVAWLNKEQVIFGLVKFGCDLVNKTHETGNPAYAEVSVMLADYAKKLIEDDDENMLLMWNNDSYADQITHFLDLAIDIEEGKKPELKLTQAQVIREVALRILNR